MIINKDSPMNKAIYQPIEDKVGQHGPNVTTHVMERVVKLMDDKKEPDDIPPPLLPASASRTSPKVKAKPAVKKKST